jgi:hypothetical protein
MLMRFRKEMPMSKSRAPASHTSDERIARGQRADALIAKLESTIALTAAQRKQALGVIAAPGLVEPHRDHHAYALGADQADCELATGDARLMRGLMSVGPTRLADMLETAARQSPSILVTRLWRHLLDTDPADFERRGAAVDAKRLKAANGVSQDQLSVFEAAVARYGVAEVHRDQRAFTFGADLYYCGLIADDANAMLGLMSIGPVRLAEQLRRAAARRGELYVARLWPELLAMHRDDYEARGRYVSWQRRWARYSVEAEAWRVSSRREQDDWRKRPMTARQRHLVRDTAISLGLTIPEGMDRGAAHDWLWRSGANIIFRKEA